MEDIDQVNTNRPIKLGSSHVSTLRKSVKRETLPKIYDEIQQIKQTNKMKRESTDQLKSPPRSGSFIHDKAFELFSKKTLRNKLE